MRRGVLHIYRDPSGSGCTGAVAQVVEFPPNVSGQQWVVASWLGKHPHITIWPSIADLLEVHGHLGASDVVWLDPDPFEPADESELLDACTQPT